MGVVVVKDGERVVEAHRNWISSGNHAEFIAIEQRAVDKVEFIDADLVITLESCTEKQHGKEKKVCAEWIKLRRIRKVWIGTLDRNPSISPNAAVQSLYSLDNLQCDEIPRYALETQHC